MQRERDRHGPDEERDVGPPASPGPPVRAARATAARRRRAPRAAGAAAGRRGRTRRAASCLRRRGQIGGLVADQDAAERVRPVRPASSDRIVGNTIERKRAAGTIFQVSTSPPHLGTTRQASGSAAANITKFHLPRRPSPKTAPSARYQPSRGVRRAARRRTRRPPASRPSRRVGQVVVAVEGEHVDRREAVEASAESRGSPISRRAVG